MLNFIPVKRLLSILRFQKIVGGRGATPIRYSQCDQYFRKKYFLNHLNLQQYSCTQTTDYDVNPENFSSQCTQILLKSERYFIWEEELKVNLFPLHTRYWFKTLLSSSRIDVDFPQHFQTFANLFKTSPDLIYESSKLFQT